MILTQIIVFSVRCETFNYSSYQYHHSNNLKVSKMSRTPQTGNPYVEPSVGNLYNVSLMAERGQDTIRW